MRTPLRRHIAQHAPPAHTRCDCRNCPTAVYPVYVIPGPSRASEEDTMRLTEPDRPDYIPASATYVRWPTPPEFANEHPNGNPRTRALIGIGIGAFIAFLLLAFFAWTATAPEPVTPRPVFVTPSTMPTPDYSPPASMEAHYDAEMDA